MDSPKSIIDGVCDGFGAVAAVEAAFRKIARRECATLGIEGERLDCDEKGLELDARCSPCYARGIIRGIDEQLAKARP